MNTTQDQVDRMSDEHRQALLEVLARDALQVARAAHYEKTHRAISREKSPGPSEPVPVTTAERRHAGLGGVSKARDGSSSTPWAEWRSGLGQATMGCVTATADTRRTLHQAAFWAAFC